MNTQVPINGIVNQGHSINDRYSCYKKKSFNVQMCVSRYVTDLNTKMINVQSDGEMPLIFMISTTLLLMYV